jgi:hypothetical protein
MNPKALPSEVTISLIDALSNSDPEELEKWFLSQGFPAHPDDPVCLASFPTEAWVNNCKVLPTPAIQRYIESEDVLNNHTIDMMELALEKNYNVAAPWCITSMRSGSEENGDLAVDYFYLLKE